MTEEQTPLARLASIADAIEAETDKAKRAKLWSPVTEPTFLRALAGERAKDALAGECELFRMKGPGIPQAEVTRINSRIVQLAKAINEAAEDEKTGKRSHTVALSRSLGPLAEGANIPEGLRVPLGYAVNPAGVSAGVDLILNKPMFIAGVSREAETGGEFVLVRWHDRRSWRERLIPRGSAMVARKLADESHFGVPVSSQTAGDAVAYIDAFLAENEPRLPVRETAAVMGWTEHGFLWGAELIGPDGPIADPPIRMATSDPGMRQFLEGYRAAGTFEGWVAAVHRMKRYPLMMIGVLSGLAPPLLKILGAPNGIVDLAGETSRGKTTGLRAAASPFGLPEDKLPGLIRLWDSTPTYIERYCSVACDLPSLLDDTRRVKVTAIIGKMLYMIAQGQGKGRGTVHGVQESTTWRTVCVSTGENPITEYAQEGGASARVLTFWGSPLDSGKLAEELAAELKEHHGHAGPLLVAWLQRPGNADRARGWYAAHRAKWAGRLVDSPVALRASQFVAVLETAEDCCRELGIPTCTEDLEHTFMSALKRADDGADKATLALREVYGWCAQNSARFYGRHDLPPDDPDGANLGRFNVKEDTDRAREKEALPNRGDGWVGRWKRGDGEDIAILPSLLADRLKEGGFEPGAILKVWKAREWLHTKGGDGNTWPVKISGITVRCVVIVPAAIAAVGEGQEEA